MAPKDGAELEAMLEYSLQLEGPCAIRYPRGNAADVGKTNKIQTGKSHQLKRGSDVEIWSVGTMAEIVMKTADILKSKGISASIINAEFIKPLDTEKLQKSASKYPLIVTVEDNMVSGGFGESIREYLAEAKTKVINIGWPDSFIEHGTADQLYKKHGMDAQSIAERIIKELER